MGPIEQNLIKQAKRFKEPLPDRIKNKPKLGLGLDYFLEAFYVLEHDRTWLTGMAVIPLPLPWGTLVKYAEVHELTGVLFEELLYFVRELDIAYVQYLTQKSTANG